MSNTDSTKTGPEDVTINADHAVSNKTGTQVTITRDGKSQEITTIDGKRVHYDKDSDTHTRVAGNWPAEADDHVRGMIADAIADREKREANRANHRNRNRMLTLVFTLVAGMAITYGLYHGWFGTWGPKVGPYSFVITVAGDTLLTLYAYVKKY